MAPPQAKKQRLSADRVLDGAVELADQIGADALTIRKLAESLDTKPMTIYHHVPNKEAIIDGMVDRVFAEITLPPTDQDWRSAILVRCRSMRSVLARHSWAAPLMESRTSPGPATLAHHDAVLGCLRRANFSIPVTGHAYATIDSFMYGFALQEAALPATGGEEMAELAGDIVEQMPVELYPYLTEFTIEHALQPGYDFKNEFEVGINLILDGIERLAAD